MRITMIGAWVWLSAASVQAGPVTLGEWSPLPMLNHDRDPFFDVTSADGYLAAIGYLLPPDVEYLHDGHGQGVGFGFEGWPALVKLSHNTDYPEGVLSYDGLSFSFDSQHGHVSSSWQGTYQALFRRLTVDEDRYWLAIEDLPWDAPGIDWDFNDAVYEAVFTHKAPRCYVDCAPPEQPVPEPASIALFGLAALAGARRLRKMSRCLAVTDKVTRNA